MPLQYDHKAELFNYVSKKNEITERYDHKEIRPTECYFEVIEHLLTNFALQEHIKNCDFYEEKRKDKKAKQGIYINYALPDEENGYSVLAVDNTNATIAVKETENQYKEKIAEELKKLGIDLERHIEIRDLINSC